MILVLAAIKKIHMDVFSLSQDGDQQVSFCWWVCYDRICFSQQILINFLFQDKKKSWFSFQADCDDTPLWLIKSMFLLFYFHNIFSKTSRRLQAYSATFII